MPLDVANDLMRARQVGEKAYQQFKTERIESSTPKTKFHDPLKLTKLKTFSSLGKQKTVNSNGRALILKADRSVFRRMMIIGQSRKIEVRELLCHSLGPLPWALATQERFPRKTNKANFGEDLRFQVASITASQIVRQWRKFLAQVRNKTSLIKFLAEERKRQQYREKLNGKTLYVTRECQCWKITEEGSEEVPELISCQEEADTRLVLHAKHAFGRWLCCSYS